MLKKYLYILSFFSILFSNSIFVPGDYSNIQLAINNTDEGDTVIVDAGVYAENIIINEHSIVLISADGAENTIIDGNQSGSVISVDSPGDSIFIIGFTIKNGFGDFLQSGTQFGGGIISHNTILKLDSLIIEDNEAFAGGGICLYDMELSSTNSIIKNSIIQNNIASEGGGIFVINQSVDIINCSINSNGMVPYGSGGGIQALAASINIDNTSINENHSRFGGGVYIGSSEAYINESIISWNISDSKGGGIWIGSGSEITTNKTLITNNFSDGFGGGIFNSLSWIIINQSTVASNIVSSSVSGAGVYSDGGEVSIYNSIVYYNRQEGSESVNHNLNGYSSSYLIEYDVEYSDIEGDMSWVPSGNGVISISPEFEENSYHLSEFSPCIDSGNPYHFDPDGTVVDMGAYFYNQNVCEISGDINLDGIVNVLDVIILIDIILDIENENFSCIDINGDGQPDVLDIICLIQIILN